MPEQSDYHDDSTSVDVQFDGDDGLHIDCGSTPFARFRQLLLAELADHDLPVADEIHEIHISEYRDEPAPPPMTYLKVAVLAPLLAFFFISFTVGVYVTGKWLFQVAVRAPGLWQG